MVHSPNGILSCPQYPQDFTGEVIRDQQGQQDQTASNLAQQDLSPIAMDQTTIEQGREL
jgi:hypothetical protein